MNSILWCGGSHMAHAQCAVKAIFSTSKNEFYVTASPALREWSIAGGRYSARNEYISRSIDNDIQAVDLGKYDHIVFVGQFLQPKRLFRSGELHSKSVIKQLIKGLGYPIYQPGGFYNEVLELFPRLVPGRCTLLCDPLPIFGFHPYLTETFLDEVKRFGNENGIKIIIQPENTIDSSMQTSIIYRRTNTTSTHFNEAFWQNYIAHAYSSLYYSSEKPDRMISDP